MKKICLLVFILSVLYFKGYSQTENFLKLNRIVVIDSAKDKVIVESGSVSTILFEIKVPNNVYWRANYFYISSSLTNILFGVKINNTYLTRFNVGTFWEKSTDIWIKPNSTIRFEGLTNGSTVGFFTNPYMYMSAQEFIVAP